jgi:hypothetical protein
MKFLVSLAMGGLLLILTTTTVSAQEGEAEDGVQATDVKLFSWLSEDPIDWETGGFLALMGLAGALVTTFTFIGGAVPGTAGKARIEADSLRVDAWTQNLDSLIADPDSDEGRIRAVQEAVNNLRDDMNAEQRRQFMVASALYAVLGSFFATALAQDLLQALLFGAGWTGIVGSLGLRSDYDERKKKKEEGIELLESQLSEAQKTVRAVGVRPAMASAELEEAVAAVSERSLSDNIALRVAKAL